jgi:hypothetical protein
VIAEEHSQGGGQTSERFLLKVYNGYTFREEQYGGGQQRRKILIARDQSKPMWL